ncbi:hypothetical protein A2U01_0013647, partial [Trifolium medium]|nr:hypothetical protein [Trifolium medium]
MPNHDDVNENLKEKDEKDSYVDEDMPGLGAGLGFGSASTLGLAHNQLANLHLCRPWSLDEELCSLSEDHWFPDLG